MILESYVQALVMLVTEGKLNVDDIKDEEYRLEVANRVNAN